jgi:hypothetical protein
VEEVVAAVEFDSDRIEAVGLLGREPVAVAGVLLQALLFFRQCVGAAEDIRIGHCGSSLRSPASSRIALRMTESARRRNLGRN